MNTNSLHGRCARIVRELAMECGWNLSPAQVDAYTEAMVQFIPEQATEYAIRPVARRYHEDHPLVHALQYNTHPDHTKVWSAWVRQAVAIVRQHTATDDRNPMLDIDDLVQAALVALVQALPTFRYGSRFSTWAYVVIGRAARHELRGLRALKRSAPVVCLDSAGDVVDITVRHAPAHMTEQRALIRLIDDVLTTHADERLSQIFRMWLADRRLVEIAGAVALSQSRVSTLLTEATTVLRTAPAVREWYGEAGKGVDT